MSARMIDPVTVAQYATFEPMCESDLETVAAIEQKIYSFPWTLVNFRDSLAAGYSAWVLRDRSTEGATSGLIIGYFFLMAALDEAHLLNISVAPERQRSGFGFVMLEKAVELARERHARIMILEVRPSNKRALYIYERYGFRQIGVRRGYYPASTHVQNIREDALVMQFSL